jgi:aminoglycoside phosphotransferase (APT) family kinase protein
LANQLGETLSQKDVPMPAPKQRDLELTRQQVCEWLRGRLPEARDLRITELTGPSTTGFSSDTLMFEAEWFNGGAQRERLVLRM